MEWLVYLGVGAGAGILAGLLGVGGGIVIVPALVFAFTGLGYPAEHIMHLALGTSLASIVFTSISSFRAHHKRGAVLWNVVKAITPGILVGSYAGSYVASLLSTSFLKGFFVAFRYWVSIQMLMNIKPKPKRSLPGSPGMFAADRPSASYPVWWASAGEPCPCRSWPGATSPCIRPSAPRQPSAFPSPWPALLAT